MPNVITFTPRPRPPVAAISPQANSLDLRAHLEEAAQTALDAADKIIVALDQIEDGPNAQPNETHPSFTAMAAHAGQVVTLREPVETPEALVADDIQQPKEPAPTDEIPAGDLSPPITIYEPLAWYGAGNVISFVGITLLSLVTRG